MIKFTIITITYNAAQVLQPTLDSVALQDYDDVEHLIVDGASTDATLAMTEAYQQASRHEVVIQSEPDRGIYDAMNKGLRRATGDYMVFLNAGDSLAQADTLSHIAAQTAPDVAVLYGDTDIVDGKGHFLRHRRLSPPEHLTWRSFRQGMLVCHQAFYVRTDIARQTPYDLRYRHSADVDWCIRVMKEAEQQSLRLVNVHAVIAHFLDGGDTTQHHRDSLKERYRVMCTHYGSVQTLLLHGWFAVRAVFKR